jgi:translation elongation factor EF-1beta
VLAYTAVLDPRKLGRDITAFIGVSTDRPGAIDRVESEVGAMDEVLECHHVTGGYTLMLKVKTRNTESLERLIDSVRSVDGVSRTETMVVLSTHTERSRHRARGRRGRARTAAPREDGARQNSTTTEASEDDTPHPQTSPDREAGPLRSALRARRVRRRLRREHPRREVARRSWRRASPCS